MYKITKNNNFSVNHTSTVLVPDLSAIVNNSGMDKVDWSLKAISGHVDLGPFTIEYELNINTSSPIDSSFKVTISVDVPFLEGLHW